MQYLYGAAHDPLIHGVFWLSGHIDTDVLKRAVTISLSAIPMIRCCVAVKAGGPCWMDHGFTGGDIVRTVSAAGDEEQQIQRLLADTIDIFHEPQLKIYVLQADSADTLCIIINHMVCDGTGFKEYLRLLADLYTRCANHNPDIPAPDFYPRHIRQLFSGFGFWDKVRIFFLKYDISMQRKQTPLRFEGNPAAPFFSTLTIDKDQVAQVKAESRLRGVTLNDMVLCAYIRVLHRRTGEARIVMPCPVDLRKYLPPGSRHGICNLTSNYICDIAIGPDDTPNHTLEQVSKQMNAQKESRSCLKSMISMALSFRLIPFSVMRSAFTKVFTIPVVSYTNLGVIDQKTLKFGSLTATDAFLTGAVKRVPYFQIAISTFDGCCTLSSNMFGTADDRAAADRFLAEVRDELLSFVSHERLIYA